MTAIDDTTVEIGLDAPKGSLLFNLAWGDAVIVSPASADGNATKPVGTGPFKFSQWVQGDRVELVKNPDYWGEPAELDKVTFKFISDPTAAFSAMMAGDIDAFPNYPAPENLAQFEADPRFKVIVGSTEGETILAMNNAREPFDDIRVRQAIAHAIDRQAIIDGAMFGYGTPIGSHFAPHHPAYVDLTALSAYDPEKSKALLAEAGVEDGLDSRRWRCRRRPMPGAAARSSRRSSARSASRPQIINVEWAQWLEQVFKGKDFDLTIVSHTEPMDIGIYARPDYYFGYDDAVMRALMAGVEATADPAEQAADPQGGAGAGGAEIRQRLPVPARQDRGGGREDRGALGEFADAGERYDGGVLGGVETRAWPMVNGENLNVQLMHIACTIHAPRYVSGSIR